MAIATVTRATSEDLHPLDQIDRALTHAYAMSVMVTGEGLGNFQTMSEQLQGEYLWAMSERIHAAKVGFELLMDERNADRVKAAA